MKCIEVHASSEAPRIIEANRSVPNASQGEVLVRVHSAGLMPTELEWYPTWHTRDGAARDHAIPSHEFAGEVAALGPGVDQFVVGELVFGMNDWFDEGALAEYCLSRPDWIARKPSRATAIEAASLPISALTAWQALFDRAQLASGERVLIHGGAGALGSLAIQLARNQGAYVITTTSSQNVAFARELGADEVVDYKAYPFETQVTNVDVVLDTIGGETLKRSWRVLKPNGRLVTVATASESTTDERVKQAFLLVQIRSDQLRRIAQLIDTGVLRPLVDRVIPMSEAAAGYGGTIQRSGRGKLVVSVG